LISIIPKQCATSVTKSTNYVIHANVFRLPCPGRWMSWCRPVTHVIESVSKHLRKSRSWSCRLYRHYKGNEYEVVDVAWHSKTLEEFIVYRALYGERGLWVWPRAMFMESVELDGRSVPRFQYVGPM